MGSKHYCVLLCNSGLDTFCTLSLLYSCTLALLVYQGQYCPSSWTCLAIVVSATFSSVRGFPDSTSTWTKDLQQNSLSSYHLSTIISTSRSSLHLVPLSKVIGNLNQTSRLMASYPSLTVFRLFVLLCTIHQKNLAILDLVYRS